MKADPSELEESAPLRDFRQFELRRIQRDLDECRSRLEKMQRAETLLAGENRLFEMIAKGNSLAPILEELCRFVEEISSGSLATILLLDPNDNRLWHAAAPSLPKSYTDSIDGFVIGPAMGSCGTAAYRKEPVIVSDIAKDPLWEGYSHLPLAYGLRASWSTPILSSQGAVLGTFAIYCREPRSPTAEHHKIIEQISHLASVAIEHKRTENALQESEERFRQMADSLPEVIWITSLDPEKMLYVSPSFERVWGLPVAEIYRNPRRWTETIHEADRDRVVSTFARWIAGEQVSYHDVEFRIIQPNGAIRWIHERAVLTLNQQGTPYRVSGISTDITERKRSEEELRRSERELQQLVDVVPQHIFVLGPDGSRVYSNRVAREYHGLAPEDPQEDHLSMFAHPDDLASVLAKRQRSIARGAPYEMEVRLRDKDGQYRWFLVRGNPLRDEQGQIIRWYGTRTDIEDRKRAEEKLRQDERELRRITDAIPQAISVLAPDGTMLYANEVVLDYTGLSLDDVKASDFRAKLFHPEDLERFRDERLQALSRGEPFEAELRARRKDGQYRWFLVRYHPLRDDEGHIIRWYATGIDIDDRKQSEERVHKENLALREEIDHSSMFEEIVGSSAILRNVLAQVAKVAPVDSTVLILGETGTGKELIARAIHKRSSRAARAFVRVNCASIPQTLIASELFGHEKGAFTGALQRRLGRFELADGGTIFLDEIGELPGETQLALLRVLQEGELERVGSSQTISVDVRVLAATNRDLKAAVAAGNFREDLFYRLNVFPIQMPSLRERVDDIPLLVEYFIERYAKKAGKKIRNIRKQTLELFQAYEWPGNIRELQNVIERAVILCETETFSVDETWLKREGQRSGPAVPFVASLVEREKEIIETALTACQGRIAGPLGAAAKLGIPRQTLESKIKTLGINKYRYKVRQDN